MLIAQIEPPHVTRGGDWFYRTHSPGIAMAEVPGVRVIDLTNVHRKRDEVLQTADVVVVNMVCDADLLPVLAERQRRGMVSVYDVNDDVASMQPWNPAAGFYANPDNQILFRMLIQACTAAQFCTPELRRIYGHLNSRGEVFRNQILMSPEAKRESGPWRTPALGKSDRPSQERVVLGWGGSIGHYDDIAHIAEPLIDFVAARDDVVLHLMCADRIGRLFERLEPHKKRLFSTGGIDAYYAFVRGLDIGLAPLQDTGFNRCRSDVKFLEYAMHGVVPLVQSLAPYRDKVIADETGVFFESREQLLTKLFELIPDAARRARIGARARRYVEEQRRERANASARVAFYRSLFGTQYAPPRESAERARTELDFAALEGAEVVGRHISLSPTRYERLLHDALVAGQLQARKSEALTMLREAALLEPSAYLPHLFASIMSEEPRIELHKCLAKSPRSLQALLALAEHHVRANEPEAAVAKLLAAAEIHPSYDLPYLRVGELLERCRESAEARGFFEIAARLRLPFLDRARAA